MKPFAFVASLIAIALALRLEGSPIHQILIWVPLIYLWGPFQLLLLFYLFLDLRRGPGIPKDLKKAFLISFIIGGAMVLSSGIGYALDHTRTQQVKSYVTAVTPLLDAFRSRHGRYPHTLSDPHLHAPAPPLRLNTEHGYTSDGSSFTFAYRNSGIWEGTLHFHSGTREWEYLDD